MEKVRMVPQGGHSDFPVQNRIRELEQYTVTLLPKRRCKVQDCIRRSMYMNDLCMEERFLKDPWFGFSGWKY